MVWIESLSETGKYKNVLKYIHDLIANIDFYVAGAKLSIDNNYFKPTICSGDDSMISAVDMRHPIVERINKNTEYIHWFCKSFLECMFCRVRQ